MNEIGIPADWTATEGPAQLLSGFRLNKRFSIAFLCLGFPGDPIDPSREYLCFFYDEEAKDHRSVKLDSKILQTPQFRELVSECVVNDNVAFKTKEQHIRAVVETVRDLPW